jgi:hypothetical protein
MVMMLQVVTYVPGKAGIGLGRGNATGETKAGHPVVHQCNFSQEGQ